MKHIHCKVFGHDFRVTRNVTYHVKEYTCKNCKKELTTNGNGDLTELTPNFKEINDVLERIHMKRHMKSTIKQRSNTNNDELEYIPINYKVKSGDKQHSKINTDNLLVFKH